MTLNQEIEQAARELGQALQQSAIVQAHRQAEQRAAADSQAQRLKARLESAYDELIQRQAAGEVIANGEIEAYYQLERDVRGHPVLAEQEQALEQLKDLFTQTHELLTNELGFNIQDMIS